jgi:hypothetical protein
LKKLKILLKFWFKNFTDAVKVSIPIEIFNAPSSEVLRIEGKDKY